jgi:hypothetical protein
MAPAITLCVPHFLTFYYPTVTELSRFNFKDNTPEYFQESPNESDLSIRVTHLTLATNAVVVACLFGLLKVMPILSTSWTFLFRPLSPSLLHSSLVAFVLSSRFLPLSLGGALV